MLETVASLLKEKLEKLQEELKGLSKILIKNILSDNDVSGDLTKARQRLKTFVTKMCS